ncbi:hypothetical protein [Streptomyces sp. NPDC051211]|uniref:hypothetical protein n=1 Tax=Streptomyces sp. NPDC051211 TaxID=3154643 RepID=UPI00345094D9
MNVMKRTLAALALSGGAAVALVPAVAHAEESPLKSTPITERIVEIADNPSQAVTDAETAVGVATSALGTSTEAAESSLTGAGGALDSGLPKAPSVGL